MERPCTCLRQVCTPQSIEVPHHRHSDLLPQLPHRRPLLVRGSVVHELLEVGTDALGLGDRGGHLDGLLTVHACLVEFAGPEPGSGQGHLVEDLGSGEAVAAVVEGVAGVLLCLAGEPGVLVGKIAV